MDVYTVCMSSGERRNILAANLEDAAWIAFQLSHDMNTQLKDVILNEKETKVLSKQLGSDSSSTGGNVP